MKNKKENPEEIFAQFVSDEEARTFAKDIKWGDDEFESKPAPEPSDSLLSDINAQVGFAVVAEHAANTRRRFYKVIAVAAVLMFVSLISVKFFNPQKTNTNQLIHTAALSKAIWQSEDIISDDAHLATLTAEINDIENQLLAIETGSFFEDGTSQIDDLESELIDIDSDFWKG